MDKQQIPGISSTASNLKLPPLAPNDEIVISGISGVFPESDNMNEFRDNLFSKKDMVTDDDRRWKLDHAEIPQRSGKVNNLSKFDASFFRVHYKQAHTMDPMCRILMEKAYEAVMDAGVNPRQLRGTRTGVFVGASFSESEKTWFYEKVLVNGFGVTGCCRSMLSNRISFALGCNGPSCSMDTACASSLYAVENAYAAIRRGDIDAAIVGGSNLCLHPFVTLQFFRLGVLSSSGTCKTFDDGADGYVRSETIAAIFIQRARDAKRVYANIVHAKTNCDGYKEQGITYPSGAAQRQLFQDFYNECGLDPLSLNFIEAHGTGTHVGDLEELNSIADVFTKNRKTPLLIGSVKSNIGHTEPASGLCSIAKVIISMENDMLAPNLHYNTPRKDIPELVDGRMKVVTESTPWEGDLVGVNSFGFGGANCHIVLKSNPRTKKAGGAPSDTLPRLVLVSGRTKDAAQVIIDYVQSRPVDVEFIRLLHDVFSQDVSGHIYRGYALLQPGKTLHDVQYYSGMKVPIWFVFSGMGSQWVGMGKSLLQIPVFAAAMEHCHQVLKDKNINIIQIITSDDPEIFKNILNCFVGIAAIQIGLVDILTSIGISPDGLLGHSVGELGCAYADGALTASQTLLAAYYRGLASLKADLIHGAMAAVGKGYSDMKDLCPPEVDIACRNSPDSCTISGPAEIVRSFVAELRDKNIFAKEVNCADIAYHSRYISKAGPLLLEYLREARTCSAHYLTHNLLNPVLFETASRHVPSNAVTLEVSPHGLLQAILRRSHARKATHVPLALRGRDSVEVLLMAIARLYVTGAQPQVAKLYPEITYPVSRGTPMIAPLVRWEHSDDWFVASYKMQDKVKSGERTVIISSTDERVEYMYQHVIDGRVLLPATGYLDYVWETFGMMSGQLHTELPIVFEDVRFHRATYLPKEGSIEMIIMVQKGSGNFEVSESGSCVVSGNIRLPEDVSKEMVEIPVTEPEDDIMIEGNDVYKELRLRGYNYEGVFRGITKAHISGTKGEVMWMGNWVPFLDALLQMKILSKDSRSLYVPVAIEKLTIDSKKHVGRLHNSTTFPVYNSDTQNIIRTDGVEIRGLDAYPVARRRLQGDPVLEKYQFMPNTTTPRYSLSLHDVARLCVHIVLENLTTMKVKTVEVINDDYKPTEEILSRHIINILADLPLVQGNVVVIAKEGSPVDVSDVPMVTVENHKLNSEVGSTLVIGHNLLERRDLLEAGLSVIEEKGFILSREQVQVVTTDLPHNLVVAFEYVVDNERFILMKKGLQLSRINFQVIRIEDGNYSWLPRLQEAMKDNNGYDRLILVAQDDPLSGILGLYNCIRMEPGGENTRCYFIKDKGLPKFDPEVPLYQDQLRKDLAVNVMEKSLWGSYRHLLMEDISMAEVKHAYNNTTLRGDLSSLTWLQGNIDPDDLTDVDGEVIHLCYASLNFRDIMISTGKLVVDAVQKHRLKQDCVQGFEFSGMTQSGRRVMGMTLRRGITNLLLKNDALLWEVPECWTLQEAATIPVAYSTVLFALVSKGSIRRGESVLIHAGTGAVGQAAIYVALHYGAEVFTTVGTPEKRAFIRHHFPQVPDTHIGNSRDTSFEQMVMTHTNGRGVDIVLNSLAGEKLQASIRCLAENGRFLEIGKYDMANNTAVGMKMYLKQTSFHGIILDMFLEGKEKEKNELFTLVRKAVEGGAVKPIIRTIFKVNEVEEAFRYMAAGKHIGKVMIEVRPEEGLTRKPKLQGMLAMPQFCAHPRYSYIIVGGLGGIGMELADWLILRGARILVLSSRSGLKTGYQYSRIRIWKSYGAEVLVSTADVTTMEGARELILQASELGPVRAIFNLAVVLQDGFLENQTKEAFQQLLRTKATSSRNLDLASRQLCPLLTHFVLFSSVSCGRGNPGQTNYGMANSVMERLCEQRRQQGLPATAIQWGAIGDVGLVADMQKEPSDLVIGGTLQQRISSCLEVLDRFLMQEHPVVSSMVVAEKRASSSGLISLVDSVANILGIRDINTISPAATLSELGMDSMMAVEIQQALERDFDVSLTPQDIRTLTFSRLQEIAASAQETEQVMVSGDEGQLELGVQGFNILLQMIGDEVTSAEPTFSLPSKQAPTKDSVVVDTKPVLMVFPGVEGVATTMVPLSRNLTCKAVCLQMGYDNPAKDIPSMANTMLPYVYKLLDDDAPFYILGYSFGSMLALETAAALEAQGRSGCVVLVDGAPAFLRELTLRELRPGNEHVGKAQEEDRQEQGEDDILQINLIIHVLRMLAPGESSAFDKLRPVLHKLGTWDERIEYVQTKLNVHMAHSRNHQNAVINATYTRIKAVLAYQWQHKPLVSSVTLIRPSQSALITDDANYGLSEICERKVNVHIVEGNHVSVIENPKTAMIIDRIFKDMPVIGFGKVKDGIMRNISDMIKDM